MKEIVWQGIAPHLIVPEIIASSEFDRDYLRSALTATGENLQILLSCIAVQFNSCLIKSKKMLLNH